MTESNRGTRIRVNVGVTSKGIPSWDATVERWDDSLSPEHLAEVVLHHSDRLHRALKERYGEQQGG